MLSVFFNAEKTLREVTKMRQAHNRLELNVEYISREYKCGKTAEAIAKELGVSKKTILTRLQEQGITRRKQPTYEIPKDKLIDLYLTQKQSTRDIAKIYGCSNNYILKTLKKYEVPIRKNAGDTSFTVEERKEKWGKRLENHHLWQGGITSLNDHLRTYTYEWRDVHLKDSGYICFISEKHSHDLQVHHAKPFNILRDEVLEELGYKKCDKVSDYTNEQISEIGELIREKHNDIKGYTIDRKLHALFHSIYGWRTTEEQLLEFKTRYINGEFNEISTRKEAS